MKTLKMKQSILAFLLLALGMASFSGAGEVKPLIAIIPEPAQMAVTGGVFKLPAQVIVNVQDTPEMNLIANSFQEKISHATGASVQLIHNSIVLPTLTLTLTQTPDLNLGKEGYQLAVNASRITVIANFPAGIFHGLQSLYQLFPKEIESTDPVAGVQWEVPCVQIKDAPRFPWRGMMLDVARHFFTKDEVKQYIDQMSHYKFNLLHLHLTDDEGWRVEIKSFPRLTTVGAYNVKKIGQFGSFSPPTADEPRNYGGFYTQDDIREIVKYAKDRYIDIMPEIDVPGHSLATVVAYPELSCSPDADHYQVISGEHMTADNTLDPSNEKTYLFLDKVVTEIAELFPFGYIHMGGDEAVKTSWEKSSSVQAFMKREGIHTSAALQGYFEKRVEKIVESKGKKFMGWDEIMDGGLGPKAAVMSWRGNKGGVAASKLGHDVVMSPQDYAYFDYMQSDAVNEPHVYATLRLAKTYQFEPIPVGSDENFIHGGQANLWTEQIFTFREVEYMTWPRALAMAEDVWSPKAKKDWNHFYPKVEAHFARFDEAEIKYDPAIYCPDFQATITPHQKMLVQLSAEIPDVELHYSFDNAIPDSFYPTYGTTAVEVPEDASQMKVATYRGKELLGRVVTMPIPELARRIRKAAADAAAPQDQ
jgi:hexosaminidase